MNKDEVSPKPEDIAHEVETAHNNPVYTAETEVVESEVTTILEGAGAGAQTDETTTDKIESSTQNMITKNETRDPKTQPKKLPDLSEQKSLRCSPTSDRAY